MEKTFSISNAKEARKKDALALAELIYDMFKEEELRENDKIMEGQNDAETTSNN